MVADQLALVRCLGIGNILRIGWRRLAKRRAKCFPICKYYLSEKRGLEIGGPSRLFKRANALPIYPVLACLDNCLFSAENEWTPIVSEGYNFRFDENRPLGRQYICEGTDLAAIPCGAYDCILSCNSLEHIANPLKAIKEWMRVLRDDGMMIVVVPLNRFTFDHHRSTTSLTHLIEDWRKNVGEDDLSHFDEIISQHDLSRDSAAGDIESFRERCRRNFEFRCMHHHVFSPGTLAAMMDFVGMRICSMETILPHNLVAILKKPRHDESVDNARFLRMYKAA